MVYLFHNTKQRQENRQMTVQKKNISLPMEVILDSIADGVFTIDTEKNITSFNKAAERITGIPESMPLDKSALMFFTPIFASHHVP